MKKKIIFYCSNNSDSENFNYFKLSELIGQIRYTYTVTNAVGLVAFASID